MATVRIQLRRDSAADWTSEDPTMTEGEIGYETDTNKFKIGDGSTVWSSLEYFIDEDSVNTKINQLLHIEDQKADTTNSGTFTTGAWRTRDLNTVVTNEITGSSLASNQITLPAGTYEINARAPVYSVNAHTLKLYNISDTADEIIGSTTYSASTGTGGEVWIFGRFTTTAAKIFEIQHRCQTTKADNGFGTPGSFGVIEVYTQVWIKKIAQ